MTFDHVQIHPRNGGFKVHFLKDQTFKGMTGINIIFEHSPRWSLSEPMAYELYRLAGMPAPLTEHVRAWMDGQPLGYQLLMDIQSLRNQVKFRRKFILEAIPKDRASR